MASMHIAQSGRVKIRSRLRAPPHGEQSMYASGPGSDAAARIDYQSAAD